MDVVTKVELPIVFTDDENPVISPLDAPPLHNNVVERNFPPAHPQFGGVVRQFARRRKQKSDSSSCSSSSACSSSDSCSVSTSSNPSSLPKPPHNGGGKECNSKIIYVSSSCGNDKNSGNTPAQALQTFKAAVSASNNNDVISLYPGEYEYDFEISSHNLSVAGEGFSTHLVADAGNHLAAGSLSLKNLDLVALAPLRLTANAELVLANDYLTVRGASLADVDDSSNIIVNDNTIVVENKSSGNVINVGPHSTGDVSGNKIAFPEIEGKTSLYGVNLSEANLRTISGGSTGFHNVANNSMTLLGFGRNSLFDVLALTRADTNGSGSHGHGGHKKHDDHDGQNNADLAARCHDKSTCGSSSGSPIPPPSDRKIAFVNVANNGVLVSEPNKEVNIVEADQSTARLVRNISGNISANTITGYPSDKYKAYKGPALNSSWSVSGTHLESSKPAEEVALGQESGPEWNADTRLQYIGVEVLHSDKDAFTGKKNTVLVTGGGERQITLPKLTVKSGLAVSYEFENYSEYALHIKASSGDRIEGDCQEVKVGKYCKAKFIGTNGVWYKSG